MKLHSCNGVPWIYLEQRILGYCRKQTPPNKLPPIPSGPAEVPGPPPNPPPTAGSVAVPGLLVEAAVSAAPAAAPPVAVSD